MIGAKWAPQKEDPETFWYMAWGVGKKRMPEPHTMDPLATPPSWTRPHPPTTPNRTAPNGLWRAQDSHWAPLCYLGCISPTALWGQRPQNPWKKPKAKRPAKTRKDPKKPNPATTQFHQRPQKAQNKQLHPKTTQHPKQRKYTQQPQPTHKNRQTQPRSRARKRPQSPPGSNMKTSTPNRKLTTAHQSVNHHICTILPHNPNP
ncbi:hypothetical protein DSO57_1021012 [Entomophthora muscae]|uniref:Uncharacterized protein n=1 Tax=Entomophthora muscae TaxID=34485 RepID=A0ACC2S5P3_9FUNG|nr:hypothetical protein DSO57_1021012 [Entomophthora muscae]